MEKKYQVFVSSTFDDLREERALIYDTLLRLGCFPTGMEQFPAADEEQLNVIGKLIEQCDYYILILAGRYGSTTADGKSYTEAEYELALAKEIPVLAFVHENPGATEKNDTKDATKWAALLQFRDRVMNGRLNAVYKDKADLAVKVMQSLTDAFNTKPRTGWVRGDRLVSDSAAAEILSLRDENTKLRSKNRAAAIFADLSDKTQMTLKLDLDRAKGLPERISANVQTSWDEVFKTLSPDLLAGIDEDDMEDSTSLLARNLYCAQHQKSKVDILTSSLTSGSIRRALIQFGALGLVEHLQGKRWRLSKLGEEKFFETKAEKKRREEAKG